MTEQQVKLLEQQGWRVECQSPIELRHDDTGSSATNHAAWFLLRELEGGWLRREQDRRQLAIDLYKEFVRLEHDPESETWPLWKNFAESAVKAADALMIELDKERPS